MEFAEVVRRRRMIRQFTDRELPAEVVDRILASALRAPSAGFAQGWGFLVLQDAADRERFWPFVPNQTAYTPAMQNAPLVVVPMAHKASYLARYAEPDKSWQDRAEAKWPAPYWHIDTGMAAMLILLSAVDEGLGAFFFWLMPKASEDRPDTEIPEHLQRFRNEFGVPDDYHPIGAIAIGYRAPDAAPQNPKLAERRRDASQVIHRGQWGTPMYGSA
ncbi:nitroreductase family protein [Kribbella antibiotica]|uniref:Nitroreductase family protein n=1 Tax=Kribbella antibiotica TaxID=190195 RepID=A0A4R4ZQE4_9ACTN|nr:nitroreductase family protein [Kribbella antibiotica]TDD60264.1 nitroreductase family protein [Kribbella antibiotica]